MFEPRNVRTETRDAFVPVSALNALRRETLDALAEARISAFAPETGIPGEMPAVRLPSGKAPDTACARTREQAEQARKAGLRVALHPEDYREEALRRLLDEAEDGDWLRLPDVCEEGTLQSLHALTAEYGGKLGGVMLGTVGQLGLDWPVPYGASESIPVMNRQAAALLFDAGCRFVTASPELTGEELRTLLAGEPPVLVPLYGRTRLMLLHHCPARTAMGLCGGHRDCAMCDRGEPDALRGQVLEDRLGHRFPLLRERLPEGCLVQLMNTLPTDNLDRPISGRMLVFTTENAEETEETIRAMRERRRTGRQTTGGHWKRPVE